MFAARYLLNTISGTLQLDHHTVRTAFGKGYEGSIGTLDGSWLDLRANSVSGDISVVRNEAASAASPSAASASAADASAPASSDAHAPQDPA